MIRTETIFHFLLGLKKLAQWFWNRGYLFICVFEIYRPTREIFTQMETTPLPVKGCCKF